MGRWRRHLDPNIRKCQWQAEEDDRLKQLYTEFGPQWSNISKRLQGRTAQQCRARWFQLCPSAESAAAAPLPHRATHGHRRDRHYDGPSIQASAKILLEQMSVSGLPVSGSTPREYEGRRHSIGNSARTSSQQRCRRSRSLQGLFSSSLCAPCDSMAFFLWLSLGA
jgi:Myb-like DNA-binding domain